MTSSQSEELLESKEGIGWVAIEGDTAKIRIKIKVNLICSYTADSF